MYHKADVNQFKIENFNLPFDGQLDPDNRWVQLSKIMPWDKIEEFYLASMSTETGREAITSRIAFGAITIKESENLSDASTVTYIQENPYVQYFLGLDGFQKTPLFDSSMMVHFRKRFPVQFVAKVNEFICTGKWPEEMKDVDINKKGKGTSNSKNKDGADSSDASANSENTEVPDTDTGDKNEKDDHTPKSEDKKDSASEKDITVCEKHGTLVIDATVAPADIKFPTDIDLLNRSREHLEKAISILWDNVEHKGHKFPYNAKLARKSFLNISKSKKWTRAKLHKGMSEQLHYVKLATERLEDLKKLAPEWEKLLPRWLQQRLNVIPNVYSQQKQMFDENTHKCEDRIVSLNQPQVRPIVRGKRPEPTEFGQKLHLSVVDGFTYIEQTSWSAYNEATYLSSAVEEYKRKFGYYPSAVLADKIYQTMANRNFCKQYGIRLSGPALGRPKKDDSDRKQMYKDACDRNVVEGRNGNLKRRYGLDLITSKLDETSKTEAALCIFAMNCWVRVRRTLLCYFLNFNIFGFLRYKLTLCRF